MNFKLEVDGIENFKTAISHAANKINRIQHLFKELNEIIIDLENDAENVSVKIVAQKEESNVRKQQGLGIEEEVSGKEAGRLQRETTEQHPEAKENSQEQQGKDHN